MPTTLKDQYPLSPKKFWKKVISQAFMYAVLSGFLGTCLGFATTIITGDTVVQYTLSYILLWILILFALIMVVYGLYVKAYIRRYYYDANESYITIKKGVFAPAEIHVQYTKIQDVYVDQDILDRIMGLYDVHLASATAASGIEAHIDGVEQEAADGLKEFLLSKLRGDSGMPPTSVSPAPSMPMHQSSAPVAFDREISSRTYPIMNAWMIQQAITWLFSSLMVSLFLAVQVWRFTDDFGTLVFAYVICFVIIYFCHMLYAVLWRSTYTFGFLPDYIVTKKGIIAKNETHLPYRSVQDVTVSQGIIERFLGIATVRIENAAAAQVVGRTVVSSAVLIPGQTLAKANEISDAVKKVALTKNSSQTGL